MNEVILFFKVLFLGFMLGFVISIPVGPSGIESIKRTISKGFREGFKVSLGAVSGDLTFLLIINCGLSSIVSSTKNTQALFWIISGIIMLLISLSTANISVIETKFSRYTKIKNIPFLAGYLMTITNPMVPSLWLTISGTIIRYWYYRGPLCYYTFLFSIAVGMVSWYILLNYLAMKGIKKLPHKYSNLGSKILMYIIMGIGFGFIVFGFIRLIF